MKKVEWIGRCLFTSPICISLCLSEEAFKKELKRLKVPVEDWPEWICAGSHATTHFFEKFDSFDSCCIVCVKHRKGRVIAQIVGLLTHEAMHVWRDIKRDIGEKEPSSEFEAYAMQNIVQQLFYSYMKQKGKKP